LLNSGVEGNNSIAVKEFGQGGLKNRGITHNKNVLEQGFAI